MSQLTAEILFYCLLGLMILPAAILVPIGLRDSNKRAALRAEKKARKKEKKRLKKLAKANASGQAQIQPQS